MKAKKEKTRIQLSDHFTYLRLFKFVYPSILMIIVLSIYGIVDGLFVSNFVGKVPFAALNFIMPLIMIVGSIGFMLSTGGAAIISKTLGEGKKDMAQKYFSMLVYVTFTFGLLLAVIAQLFVRRLALFMGAEGEMLEYCVIYARIALCSGPFFMLQFLFQELCVTAEKPSLGFIVTLISGCTNMVLDALFIMVFDWGLEGAALATAFTELVGGVIPLIYFSRKNDSLLRLCKTKIYWRILGKSCTNGCSEFVNSISGSVVAVIFNIQLLKYAGENGVAAYGVIMYVCIIFLALFMGYVMGVSPIIGFNFGAQNHSELNNIFKKSIRILVVLGVLMSIFALLFAKPLAAIFVGYDAELLEMTSAAMRIYAMAFIVSGINIFGSAMFTALNNGLISAAISFLRTLVFECGSVLVLPIFFGLSGIWCSIIVAELVALIVTTIFVVANRKRYHYY